MFQDNPTFAIVNFAIAAYRFYMWFGDFNLFRRTGEIKQGALAGATTSTVKLAVIAVVASLVLLVSHTSVEIACGVESEQTKVAPWALFSWIGAAFVEELIFRGYLVVQNKGKDFLWLSVILFSFVFAIGHPFIWDYTVAEGTSVFAGQWKFDFSIQPILSTIAIFECSLLFYVLRFIPANKNRSLIPCICAHCAYNVGVFATKAFQGFVAW